jgi:glycosyltransferase involved in cell wall biosynthesis
LKKIKVVFLVRSLNYGGVERQLTALLKAIDLGHFDPVVCCFYGGGNLLPELNQAGIQVDTLDKQSRWDILLFFWRLVKYFREMKPEIVHGFLPVPNFLAACLKIFVPGMKVVMGVRTSGKDLRNYDWTFRFSFWLELQFSALADLIIVNSAAGKKNYEAQGYSPAKMVVIPNGIDTSVFRDEPASRKTTRREWGIPGEAVVIGLIGRLDPMKGHAFFLRAAANLAREFPNVYFVCVGDGLKSTQEELAALGEGLDLGTRLVWSAARSDIGTVYNALDICCSASIYGEGFPNVIGEAMACAVPCVITDVGDSAAVVGETGMVIAPGDVSALTQGLRKMIVLSEGERHNLGMLARQRIVENFTTQAMVLRTESALAKLVEVEK